MLGEHGGSLSHDTKKQLLRCERQLLNLIVLRNKSGKIWDKDTWQFHTLMKGAPYNLQYL